jgi:hypothetical protein
MTDYLTVAEVLAIHEDQIARLPAIEIALLTYLCMPAPLFSGSRIFPANQPFAANAAFAALVLTGRGRKTLLAILLVSFGSLFAVVFCRASSQVP